MNAHASDDPGAENVEELIIRMSTLSYERLPMLEVIVDRYVLSLASALKSFCGVPVEITLDTFTYMTCGEALDSLPSPSLLAVTSADPWEGTFLTSVGPELLFSALEILLGGRTVGKRDWSPRSFTAIERRFGTRLTEVILTDLAGAFSQLAEVSFRIDYLESNPQATALAPMGSPCVKIRLDATMEDRGGPLEFVIPFTALEKIRPVLSQPFLGGKLGGDSSWRKQLVDKIEDTTVSIDAHLHELTLPMTDVLSWRRGQTIDLGIGSDHEVTVVCSGRPMFSAAMGRRANGSVALRVTEELHEKGESSDDDATD